MVDGSGNLFISGANNTSVRKVNASGIISTFAGNPNVTGNPLGLATDASGSLFLLIRLHMR
ncbi:MAG: hypothetical protein IPP46_04735 [Bacteroidetes bacterium]|nr:hypothetical protein [Bacteroidota bacterium]